MYAHSENEAWRKLEDARIRSGGKHRTRSPETVAGFLQSWLDDIQEQRKATTAATYAMALKNILSLTLIENRRVSDFDRGDARALYDYLRSINTTRSIHHKIHIALHAAFETAVRDDIIARNPFHAMAPKYQPAAMKAFTSIQARRFLKACDGHPLEALFVLALSTGIRQGELLALKWEDIDFKSRRLAIRRSLQEVGSKLEIVEPKTASGRRSVALGGLAIDALRQRQKVAAREGHGSAFAFTTPTGYLIRKPNLRRRVFEPLLTKAKVPKIRFHDLRHSAATLLLGSNVHPKIVSEMLGHSRVGVTLDVYSHALPGMQAAAAALLSGVLGGSASRAKKRG